MLGDEYVSDSEGEGDLVIDEDTALPQSEVKRKYNLRVKAFTALQSDEDQSSDEGSLYKPTSKKSKKSSPIFSTDDESEGSEMSEDIPSASTSKSKQTGRKRKKELPWEKILKRDRERLKKRERRRAQKSSQKVESSEKDTKRQKLDTQPPSEEESEKDSEQESTELTSSIMSGDLEIPEDTSTSTHKKHCCYFCHKMYPKVAKHQRQKHKIEPEIKNIVEIGNYKLRKVQWDHLRNLGDAWYNERQLRRGVKDFVVKYEGKNRPRKDTAAPKEILPCVFCKVMYTKEYMWKHEKECRDNPDREELRGDGKQETSRYKRVAVMARAQTMIHYSKVKGVQEILARMTQDHRLVVIKNDSLLMKFMEHIYQKWSHYEKVCSLVSQPLRELSKLLIKCREEHPERFKNASDLIAPPNFDILLETILSLQEFDGKNEFKKSPSNVMKMGGYLRKLADWQSIELLKRLDFDGNRENQAFLTLMDKQYTIISKKAKFNLTVRKFNKEKVLPLFKDISKFHEHLEVQINNLKERSGVDVYRNLAQYVMAQIIMFNRKRSGEVERLNMATLKDGLQRDRAPDPEFLENLQEFEKNLAAVLTRIEFLGKASRKISILLTTEMHENLQIMLRKRELYVHDSVQFVFARPGNHMTPIEGHLAIKKVAEEAQVSNIPAFTSTNLRKHLATMSQVLNIDVLEQDLLAQFMGHDLNVHRDYYRRPQGVIEKCKVAQVLIAINSGKNKDQFKNTSYLDQPADCALQEVVPQEALESKGFL